MKVLVTGYNGQLGYDVIKNLQKRNIQCKGVDLEDFDITDKKQTYESIKEYNPDVVVHCAAYTAVDAAEENEALCRKINVDGTENIAVACADIDAEMLYVSTDYVYGGKGEKPFEVTDETAPQNVYGQTKLDGEIAMMKHLKKYYIVRTSWVFGINGKNFVKTITRLSQEKEELNVVSDQIGSPTYTPDLAELICNLIQTKKYGTYHGTNEGFCSWAEFATEIIKKSGNNCKVIPVLSGDYQSKAKRPLNSRLSKRCLDEVNINRLPYWKDALDRFFKEMKE
ncbi:MAG: dTDP-4-dehydrorhamnose reductase [Ruminococcus sp.]|nr:dTDP-4-dehydrorhamnose reductase [Candidatus Copronaster equi]